MKRPYLIFLICLVMALSGSVLCGQEVLPANESERSMDLKRDRGTIYELLNNVSAKFGYFFIYDSRILDNDRKSKLKGGEYTLEEAVREITGFEDIRFEYKESYVLLKRTDLQIPMGANNSNGSPMTDSLINDTLYNRYSATIKDRITGEAVIYGSITVEGTSYGTITNGEGEFTITLPDSLRDHKIKISHIGFISRSIDISLLKESSYTTNSIYTIFLDQKIVPLQEVVVRVTDPVKSLRDVMAFRERNYSTDPSSITAFYREGVKYKDNQSISEAVLKIYKTGYQSYAKEQVKMLKMRRITGNRDRDSLVTKVRSGIFTALLLDIIKNPPDFLTNDATFYYNFTHTDITVIDDQRVHVFSFEPREYISDPLYIGKLYVNMSEKSLVRAEFKVNPMFAHKMRDVLVIKKSRNIRITPVDIAYEISYRKIGDKYFINHIRGDLGFRVKKRRALLSSPLNIWFEMVNCKTDTLDVHPFNPEERIAPRDIFSEIFYRYDSLFWENLNIIKPEEDLRRFIEQFSFEQ